MQIDVHITDTETGETRVYKPDFEETDSEWSTADEGVGFMWGEGNYSCDCNRGLFFERVNGSDAWDEVGCSDGLFSVRITDNGELLYQDGDNWS